MRNRTHEEWTELAARIRDEGPLTLKEAARLVPVRVQKQAGGTRSHVSVDSVKRWILKGLNGVRLEGAVLSGKGWCTSRPALDRFAAWLSMIEEKRANIPPMETPRMRDARVEAAIRELNRELGDA